jgi:hypothetical protein
VHTTTRYTLYDIHSTVHLQDPAREPGVVLVVVPTKQVSHPEGEMNEELEKKVTKRRRRRQRYKEEGCEVYSSSAGPHPKLSII